MSPTVVYIYTSGTARVPVKTVSVCCSRRQISGGGGMHAKLCRCFDLSWCNGALLHAKLNHTNKRPSGNPVRIELNEDVQKTSYPVLHPLMSGFQIPPQTERIKELNKEKSPSSALRRIQITSIYVGCLMH
jgi:hypothetical protein